jgi:Mlc titration factor MtfA (ptsG expression regulator)
MNPILIIFILLITGFIIFYWIRRYKNRWKRPEGAFPAAWKMILAREVAFYNSLSEDEKKRFEYKVQEFLLNCRITGIDTTVDDTDELLVASSAIIPVFAFDEWRYSNIDEVLLYAAMFNKNFDTEGADRNIMGMVGYGYMNGIMTLSKPALRHGFRNETDKKNTAIHEFVHLIDKADGSIDGIPSMLLEKQYTIPWIDMISKKIEEISEGNSDINPYGGSNRAEFFAVAGEYFFERPVLLKRKHPELYDLMQKAFKRDMSLRPLRKNKTRIGRNSPCPCNSGKKFKHCCGGIHHKRS